MTGSEALPGCSGEQVPYGAMSAKNTRGNGTGHHWLQNLYTYFENRRIFIFICRGAVLGSEVRRLSEKLMVLNKNGHAFTEQAKLRSGSGNTDLLFSQRSRKICNIL